VQPSTTEPTPIPPQNELSDFEVQDENLALLSGFFSYLEAEKNASSHTLVNYRIDLSDFSRFIKKKLTDVSYPDFRRFLGFLSGKGFSKRSVSRKISTLKSFYKYLRREDIVEKNTAAGMPYPKLDADLPKFMHEQTVAKLIDSIPEDAFLSLRDKAIMELLYASGMRISELVSLDRRDVDLIGGAAKVRGKGKKERMVLIGSTAEAVLEKYMAARTDKDNAFFVNKNGTRITAVGIRKKINVWVKKLAMGEHVTPHMFRHSFATHLLSRGADLRSVQELLGHANVTTTQVYTHLTVDNLKRVYDKAHPRAHEQATGNKS